MEVLICNNYKTMNTDASAWLHWRSSTHTKVSKYKEQNRENEKIKPCLKNSFNSVFHQSTSTHTWPLSSANSCYLTWIIISQLSTLYTKIIPLGNICMQLTSELLILRHQLRQLCLYIPPGLLSPLTTVLLEKPTYPQSGIKFPTLYGISLESSQELHTSPYP